MDTDVLKSILSFIAVLLTFIAYVPYYRDIIHGKTHPHVYSWSLWCLLTILIVALQIKGGAGWAALVPAAAGLLCLGVIILGFVKRTERDITVSDTIVAALALIATGLWLVADQPETAVVLGVLADVLAFIPTVRKSWSKPYSETLSLYAANTFRFSLALLAVREYNLLSALWPATWVICNGLFVCMLVVRRKRLAKN